MSVPWSLPAGVRELLATVAICALAFAAGAQTLDIRPASQPAGAGASVAAARQELAEELLRIDATHTGGAQARRALRAHAIALLAEDAPPEMALIGRTLWRLMDELDARIEVAGDAEASHAASLLGGAHALETAGEAETLLRDALAPLAGGAAGEIGGWIDVEPAARPGGALSSPLDAAFLEGLVAAGFDQELADRLGAMEADLLSEADEWQAYRRSSAATSEAVTHAN